MYQYDVCFEPQIESKHIRSALLNSHSKVLPVKTFDGKSMYTFEKLPNDITELECLRNYDQQKVTIRIKLVKNDEDNSLAKLMSIVFRRSLYKCKLRQFGKQAYFDFNNMETMRQYHLKIAPGFITSINLYKSKVLLCSEVVHKIISTKTVFDEMNEIYNRNSGSERWKEECCKKLVGSTVMTSHNFRSYRIDDIDWEQTPLSSFKKKDGSITFVDYYYQNYQVKIHEVKQPLLLVRIKDKNNPTDPDKHQIIYLVPSLCLLAGNF